MDVDNSFGEDFGDVLISHPFLEQSPVTSAQSKRKSSLLMNEMKQQLEESCFEISAWCEQISQQPVSSDILVSLRDGVVLCQVAEILYPSQPPSNWIHEPKEYMDYNINISAFGDHCKAIGIDQNMIIDYVLFDERDLSCLVTFLLEYISFFNTVNSQSLPSYDAIEQQKIEAELEEAAKSELHEVLLPPDEGRKSKGFTCCRP